MAQLIEFATNNLLLVSALAVIAALIIKTEIGLKFTNIQQLNVNEAVRLMNDSEVVVLDVRENNEYKTGHIRDSIHIPMSSLSKRLTELEKHKNKQILAYCRSGSRSNSACRTLNKQGFEHVSNLAGGIMSWTNANLPVTNK
ncbi:MAG: rhodanese-like domain-containing protein [Gammaproteobacteria bacterium]|nr:rhodanese-like domain-containing protein [Gammaproteobacteria bacterium]